MQRNEVSASGSVRGSDSRHLTSRRNRLNKSRWSLEKKQCQSLGSKDQFSCGNAKASSNNKLPEYHARRRWCFPWVQFLSFAYSENNKVGISTYLHRVSLYFLRLEAEEKAC